jgi:hypothetical protein
MPQIRNTSSRDLEVAGRVIKAGQQVEVGEHEAEFLASNPNFVLIKPKPVSKHDEGADRAGKKD